MRESTVSMRVKNRGDGGDSGPCYSNPESPPGKTGNTGPGPDFSREGLPVAALFDVDGQGDAELDDSERAELRARFQPEALGLLREAVRRGMKDPAEFEHEDYGPLRGVEEFEALRAAVRADVA